MFVYIYLYFPIDLVILVEVDVT